MPVSSKTGAGVADLRAALRDLAARCAPRGTDQLPRLPIDRVFTIKGFGTVVTGTLMAGRLRVDDRVEVYPRSLQAKVRGLQTHGQPVTEASAGQRTAVNLQGVERLAVERGDVVGLAGTLVPSVLMDGTLELLADAPRPVKTRDRVRFHVGTSEVMARVLLLDRQELVPGQSAFARFRLEAPLVAMPDDRFVVRSYSPMVTIGGGTLLDIAPPRFKRKGPALIAHLTLLREGRPETVVEEHVRHAGGGGVRLAALSGRVPFGPERLRALARRLQAAAARWRRSIATGSCTPRASSGCAGWSTETLAQFHRAVPAAPGMSREELRGRAGAADERVFGHLLSALEAEGIVKAERDKVRLATHEVRLTPEQQQVVDRLEAEFLGAAAAPPSPEEAHGAGRPEGDEEHELFQVLVEPASSCGCKESLFFHASALEIHPGQARGDAPGAQGDRSRGHQGPARDLAASTRFRSWSSSTGGGSPRGSGSGGSCAVARARGKVSRSERSPSCLVWATKNC